MQTRFVNRVQDFIFLFIFLQFKVLIITMIKNNFDIVKQSEIISEFYFWNTHEMKVHISYLELTISIWIDVYIVVKNKLYTMDAYIVGNSTHKMSNDQNGFYMLPIKVKQIRLWYILVEYSLQSKPL